jgi:hypothetical protein
MVKTQFFLLLKYIYRLVRRHVLQQLLHRPIASDLAIHLLRLTLSIKRGQEAEPLLSPARSATPPPGGSRRGAETPSLV